MTPTRLKVAAALIACLILASFLVSILHMRGAVRPSVRETSVATTVPSIALRDSVKKGVHTLTGSIDAPDACTTVSATASLAGTSTAASILVAISMPLDAGVCLQEKSTQQFSATLAAPANLPIIVTVNGATATATAL